jgi:hypothetical protein
MLGWSLSVERSNRRLCFQLLGNTAPRMELKYYHSRNLSSLTMYYAAVFCALLTACLFYLYGRTRNYFTACMLMCETRGVTQIGQEIMVLVEKFAVCENRKCGNFYVRANIKVTNRRSHKVLDWSTLACIPRRLIKVTQSVECMRTCDRTRVSF